MRIIEPNAPWSPYPVGRSLASELIALDNFLPCHGGRNVPCKVGDIVALDDSVLEIGLAPTTKHESAPFIDHEISDGIPIAHGDESVTKPANPPKGSTCVFTESEKALRDFTERGPDCKGMRW